LEKIDLVGNDWYKLEISLKVQARIIKNQMRKLLREAMHQMKQPGSEPYIQVGDDVEFD
jgi:hypothetical protein